MNKINLFYVNIGLLFFLFPFASPVPLFTDVQPLCFIYGAIYLIFTNSTIPKKNLRILSLVLLFALMSLVVVNIDGVYLINRRVGGLAVAITLIYFLKNLDFVSVKFVERVIQVHLVIMIFQYLFPGLFDLSFAHFIRASTYFEGDNRGVSGLNAEPGGGAAVIFGLFVLHQYRIKCLMVSDKNKETFKGFVYFLAGMLLTHGGVSVVLFLMVVLYLIIEFGYWKISLIFLGMFFSVGFFLIGGIDALREFGRGAELLVAFFNEGFEIVFTDGSMAERFLGLAYGYNSLKINPFGVGGGGYHLAASKVEEIFNLGNVFYTARPQIDDTVSVVGIYMAEYGVIFLMFISLLMYMMRPKSISFIIFQFVGIAFLFFSYSFAFPITWLIFACCYLERKKYRSNSY